MERGQHPATDRNRPTRTSVYVAAGAPMFALKRITDSSRTSRHVRKVPLPDSCTATNGRSLFDHHVGQHDAKIVLFPTSAGMIREQPPFISTGVRKYGPA